MSTSNTAATTTTTNKFIRTTTAAPPAAATSSTSSSSSSSSGASINKASPRLICNQQQLQQHRSHSITELLPSSTTAPSTTPSPSAKMTTKKPSIFECPMMMQRNYSLNDTRQSVSHDEGQPSDHQQQHQRNSALDPMTFDNNNSIVNDIVDDENHDKIDLKHIAIAAMKLLYPKANDIFEVMRQKFMPKNADIWNGVCQNYFKKFESTENQSSFTDLINNSGKQQQSIQSMFDELESFNSVLADKFYSHCENSGGKNTNQNHKDKYLKELIIEYGEKYIQKLITLNDRKQLLFIGENLIDFWVNIENIQSNIYNEINNNNNGDSSDTFQHPSTKNNNDSNIQITTMINRPWQSSQPDQLPISVYVNNLETRIILTYDIIEPINNQFLAIFMSSLLQCLTRLLFKIIISINVDIGTDQYKFIIENYYHHNNRHNDSNSNLNNSAKPLLKSLINDDTIVSRYKSYLINQSLNNHDQKFPSSQPQHKPTLLMYIKTFRKVFPFHFVCDQNLRFIQYGIGLSKIFGHDNSKYNQHISNVFIIKQPNVGFFFESIRHRINLAFILRIRDNICTDHNSNGIELHGQIIECHESKSLLFLGSPIVKGLKSLTSRGLFLSDIPIHDATRDIILIEEQSRAQESLKRRMDKLKQTIQRANEAVEIERRKNVNLLNLIFPAQVARQLWLGKSVEARQYDNVTMLFSDIVGFTAICSTATPIAVINMLNDLYTQFDAFCGEIDVYKTETIGDAYCVASGLHRQTKYHAVLAAFMALKMLDVVKHFTPKDINVDKFQMRIGLHSGSCLAGIVGVRMPRYCLFGANVTLANKFESHSEAQRINISPTTYRLLQQFKQFTFTIRDPSCLPKECPSFDFERVASFVDCYHYPNLSQDLSLNLHIQRALNDINDMKLTSS